MFSVSNQYVLNREDCIKLDEDSSCPVVLDKFKDPNKLQEKIIVVWHNDHSGKNHPYLAEGVIGCLESANSSCPSCRKKYQIEKMAYYYRLDDHAEEVDAKTGKKQIFFGRIVYQRQLDSKNLRTFASLIPIRAIAVLFNSIHWVLYAVGKVAAKIMELAVNAIQILGTMIALYVGIAVGVATLPFSLICYFAIKYLHPSHPKPSNVLFTTGIFTATILAHPFTKMKQGFNFLKEHVSFRPIHTPKSIMFENSLAKTEIRLRKIDRALITELHRKFDASYQPPALQ